MSPARVRGPVAVAVFLVLAAAAVTGGWLALSSHPQAAGIVELAAIDGEYAVLVREVENDPERWFLSLFHVDRGEVWGGLVPRYTVPPGQHTALVTTAGVVAARAESEHGIDLIAFDAARGEKMGRLEVTNAASGDARAAHAGSVFANRISYELLHAPGGGAALAIDLARGQPRWRTGLGQGRPELAWLRGQHLLVYAGGRLHILEQGTGRAAAGTEGGIALDPHPCVLAERVYGRRQGVLHRVSLPGGQERTIPAPIAGQVSGMCGRYRDRDVLATTLEDGNGAVVAVDRDTGDIAWTLALDSPLATRRISRPSGLDHVSLSGALPRFVPLVLEDGELGHLVMLDLDTGRVAWRSRPGPGLRDAHLIRERGQPHAWLGLGAHVAVLDGNTGTLRAAVSLNKHAPLWPESLAGGRLWLHDDTRWAVLDAGSLALVSDAGHLVSQSDARTELARELALPLAPRAVAPGPPHAPPLR